MRHRFFRALGGLAAALALCGLLGGCAQRGQHPLLAAYKGLVELAGSLTLDTRWTLAGERAFAADHYTGTYSAEYRGETTTEYLFGGASADAGARTLAVLCTLRIDAGRARVFLIRGDEPPATLLETDGAYAGTLALPAGVGQTLIGVSCVDFTGTLQLDVR